MIFIFVFGLLLPDLVSGTGILVPAPQIIGGTDSPLAAYPYIVSLRVFFGGHSCAGVIVADQWILTAAHCVEFRIPWLYSVSLNDGTLYGARRFYGVERIIVHPDFRQGPGVLPNDIALLKLRMPMDFNEFGHSPALLANPMDNFDGMMCSIAGWGVTETGRVSNILQEADGIILTNPQCRQAWGQLYNPLAHMCIQDNTSGACNGDSGGPLQCGAVLAGLTSWGRQGCNPADPSVYTRVSTYRVWIDGTIAANSFIVLKKIV